MKEYFENLKNKVKKSWKKAEFKKYAGKTYAAAQSGCAVVRKLYAGMYNKLNVAGTYLGKIGISANVVSWTGFIIGIFAINFIAMGMYGWALFAILLNRLCDGLDGAIARSTKITDFGVFLDAALDYIFYGGVIFAFALAILPKMHSLRHVCCLVLLLPDAPCWLIPS